MTTATVNDMTAVERAAHGLREAIATGNEKKIDRAARALESARETADRETMRRKDRLDAEQKVAAERREADRIESKARADRGEAAVRALTPELSFVACGRRVIIALSVPGLSPDWSVEATRRLTWSMAKSFAERIVASRNAGAAAPEQDYLTSLMADETHGLAAHLRRGVVRVEKI